MMQLMQLLPLLILVIFTLVSFVGNTEERWFSLQPDDAFTLERRTSHPHVTRNLPYFVRADFANRVAGDRYTLLKVRGRGARCGGALCVGLCAWLCVGGNCRS